MMTVTFNMGTHFLTILTLMIVFINDVRTADDKVTICGQTGYKQRIDCLLNKTGVTTFGRATYEEALSSAFSDKLFVHSEIHPKNDNSNAAEVEVVIVVKDANVKTFQDLKGAKVCYPGFKDGNVARYFISNFENAIINSVTPDVCLIPKYPYIGKHIKALHDLFSESCRPGVWVNHAEVDDSLKKSYWKLCELCDATENYGCSTDHVEEPFRYALECFEGNGTVAILTKDLARSLKSPLFLNRNGSVGTEPYVWFLKPREFVISNKKNPERVTEITNLNETTVNLPNPVTLEKYLTGFINERQVKPKCVPKVNWCTYPDPETEECELLKKVVSQQSIPLDVECTEKIDKMECVNSVAHNETDILTAQNIYGYIARSKFLEPIAYPGVNVANATKSMVVVRSEDETIKGFKDLKEKFGCFSQFGDIAFFSFVNELQQQGIIKTVCTLDEFLSFAGISCMPGIIDPNWESLPSDADISTFCKCAGRPTSKTDVQCSATYDNKYYANEGALECLSNIGNYAVLSDFDVENRLNNKKFSVLCKNNKKKHFSDVLKDDEDCFLTITPNQEIMYRRNDILEIDIIAMLSDLDAVPKNYGLFENFNYLMFQNSIPKIYFKSDDDRYVQNYNKLFSAYDQCTENKNPTNSAGDLFSTPYFYLLPIITLMFRN